MKKLFIEIIALGIAMSAQAQSGGKSAQSFPTNILVDATNKVFTVPFAFNWISLQNDSGTNIYLTPGTEFRNITQSNYVFYGSGVYSNAFISNRVDIVTNSIAYTAQVGKGTVLNAGGGSVFYDQQGICDKHTFQFISKAGSNNNVCIQIGVGQ